MNASAPNELVQDPIGAVNPDSDYRGERLHLPLPGYQLRSGDDLITAVVDLVEAPPHGTDL